MSGVPIRDLGLTIVGTRLEPILGELMSELERAGLRQLRPRFYLSTEWGVPMGTIAVAIPFYLARSDLTQLHVQRTGHIEGVSRIDILRYLRHEVGHAVNYAYRLYEGTEWTRFFGSITQPYVEDYKPSPFSRRYVCHLPGWYAQKHPDEDWAETFAVWLTPRLDWRASYGAWPEALAKLEYCDHIMAEIRDREPLVSNEELDEDIGDIGYSLDEYYRGLSPELTDLPVGIDGALRAIFEDVDERGGDHPSEPASRLFGDIERDLLSSVYRFSGHFPEKTRVLVAHLAERADALGLTFYRSGEREATVALTALVTALAMSHVYTGSYLP